MAGKSDIISKRPSDDGKVDNILTFTPHGVDGLSGIERSFIATVLKLFNSAVPSKLANEPKRDSKHLNMYSIPSTNIKLWEVYGGCDPHLFGDVLRGMFSATDDLIEAEKRRKPDNNAPEREIDCVIFFVPPKNYALATHSGELESFFDKISPNVEVARKANVKCLFVVNGVDQIDLGDKKKTWKKDTLRSVMEGSEEWRKIASQLRRKVPAASLVVPCMSHFVTAVLHGDVRPDDAVSGYIYNVLDKAIPEPNQPIGAVPIPLEFPPNRWVYEGKPPSAICNQPTPQTPDRPTHGTPQISRDKVERE